MGPASEIRQSVMFTARELAGLRALVDEARVACADNTEFDAWTEIAERLGAALERLKRKVNR